MAVKNHNKIIVGHRGTRVHHPENTAQAFDFTYSLRHICHALGYDLGLECDLFLTQDGVPVITHDANTLRTTGVDKLVEKSTLTELQALSYNALMPEKQGTLITLAEFISRYPEAYLEIELKHTATAGQTIIHQLHDRIKADGHLQRFHIFSFDKDLILYARHHIPAGVRVSALFPHTAITDRDSLSRPQQVAKSDHPVHPFALLPFAGKAIPAYYESVGLPTPEANSTILPAGCIDNTQSELVSALKRQGNQQVGMWEWADYAPVDKAMLGRALDLGVNMLSVDDPLLAIETLIERQSALSKK